MELSTRRILLAFIVIFVLGMALAFLNVYNTMHLSCGFCPWMYVIALLGTGVGGFIVLLFQWKINKIQLMKVLAILPQEERKIMELLITKDSMTQTDLRYNAGLSKVKLSRILSRLEQRGAIEKIDYGNTNLVKTKIKP
jgi:uncharacterized membrane protein